MTRIQATFHYALRGLVVEPDLLGSAFTVNIDDYEVTLVFPVAGSGQSNSVAAPPAPLFDERFPTREKIPLVDGARDLTVVMSRSGAGPSLAEVDLLRVHVVIPNAELKAADFGASREAPGTRDRQEIDRASAVADTAIDRLIAWARVRYRQVWLGLFGEPAKQTGAPEVVDLDSRRRLPWLPQPELSFNVVERDVPLNRERFEALLELVGSGDVPGLGQSLLADARFVELSAEPPDPPRALLIAALACEVSIKTFLRLKANNDQAPLVELLLSNPRDWSLAAAALFDKPLRIVAGRSLRDEAGGVLWRRVNKLFERRNALAHRGTIPTPDEVRDSLGAARELFDWLDEIYESAS